MMDRGNSEDVTRDQIWARVRASACVLKLSAPRALKFRKVLEMLGTQRLFYLSVGKPTFPPLKSLYFWVCVFL